MTSFIQAIAPMFFFFFVPIAIPMVAAVFGALTDWLHPHRLSVAEAAVIAAKARSAPWREEMARLSHEASVKGSALPLGSQNSSAEVGSNTRTRVDGDQGGRTAA